MLVNADLPSSRWIEGADIEMIPSIVMVLLEGECPGGITFVSYMFFASAHLCGVFTRITASSTHVNFCSEGRRTGFICSFVTMSWRTSLGCLLPLHHHSTPYWILLKMPIDATPGRGAFTIPDSSDQYYVLASSGMSVLTHVFYTLFTIEISCCLLRLHSYDAARN